LLSRRRNAMSQITLDSQLRAKLNGLNDQIEICDETGKTVGRYLPESLYRELLLAWSKADMPDEELQRRRREPRGRTLPEIWDRLSHE
jgi:hypothetical protein